MKFRKDINGLRAIAVISVVLFHFNSSWLPGGFAGVDVFFVISGFLMTSIIFKKVDYNTFSLKGFYLARANRLIPALSMLCLTLAILGWFYLLPIDYLELGKNITSSVLFISNITYWLDSGYFSPDSHENWLLHTWSLSAEWQFYIIYPIIIIALKKLFNADYVKRTLVLLTIIGFVFSAIVSHLMPNPSYFLLPTRAWEMMLGGLIALYPISLNNQNRKKLSLLGLTLITVSFFVISKENIWPGYLALIPTAGTALVILANYDSNKILNGLAFQKLGAWSYSIYLWHWPVYVFIYTSSLNENTLVLLIGISASILLGFCSYKYVEGYNFDTNKLSKNQFFTNKPIQFSILLSILGSLVYVNDGLSMRIDDSIKEKNVDAIQAVNDWYFPNKNATVANKEVVVIDGVTDKNILFIGASHIEHTYPYVETFESKYNIYYLTKGGCFLTPSFKHPSWSCNDIQDYSELIKKVKFDKIVTSFYFFNGHLSKEPETQKRQISNRIIEFDNFLKIAKNNSKDVYLILGEPQGKEFDPAYAVRNNSREYVSESEVRKGYKLHMQALNQLTELDGVTIIDPINDLCREKKCDTLSENTFFYKDQNHFRPWYARKYLTYLDPILL